MWPGGCMRSDTCDLRRNPAIPVWKVQANKDGCPMRRDDAEQVACCSPEVADARDILVELLLGQAKVGHLDPGSGKACRIQQKM